MSARSWSLAVCIAALAALPAAAQAAFPGGVIAGDVSSTSAILWSQSDHTARYTLRWGTTQALNAGSAADTANKPNDFTMRATATGLQPGTTYFYQWSDGSSASPVGRFSTAPSANADRTIRFGWSGDMDGTAAPGQSTPYW